MGPTHLIIVAFLAVPTLQQKSCSDETSNCQKLKSRCGHSAAVKRLCSKTCGVCTSISCDPSCVNGPCTGHNTCMCHPGWEGSLCQNAVCDPQCTMGACMEPNTCTYDPNSEEPPCDDDFKEGIAKGIASICMQMNQDGCKDPKLRHHCKSLCSSDSCTRNCKNGACSSTFTCECSKGFQGPNCDAVDFKEGIASICMQLNQDGCKDPTLRHHCKSLCSSDSCTRNCKNGACSSTFTCECSKGFQGPNCDAAVLPDGSDCQHPWHYINNNLTQTCVTVPGPHGWGDTWEGARTKCQELGADLPMFSTMQQMEGLYQYFRTWNRGGRGIVSDHWIRGYRNSDGKSYWADGTEISSDLFCKKLYWDRKYVPSNKSSVPIPTTIEKECLIFRPAWGPDNQLGIFNHGNIKCDKQPNRLAVWTMCQKYVV